MIFQPLPGEIVGCSGDAGPTGATGGECAIDGDTSMATGVGGAGGTSVRGGEIGATKPLKVPWGLCFWYFMIFDCRWVGNSESLSRVMNFGRQIIEFHEKCYLLLKLIKFSGKIVMHSLMLVKSIDFW